MRDVGKCKLTGERSGLGHWQQRPVDVPRQGGGSGRRLWHFPQQWFALSEKEFGS